MGEIALEGMEFFAYHGFYDEEQKIGNKYVVDVWISCDLTNSGKNDDLSKTVNYEKVYEFVASIMLQPTKLLETLSYKIGETIKNEFPFIEYVKVAVTKMNPPIGGICRQAKVTIKQ